MCFESAKMAGTCREIAGEEIPQKIVVQERATCEMSERIGGDSPRPRRGKIRGDILLKQFFVILSEE
ncbi:hypothetical protein O3M35_005675 [Rhynocoris fuscipes]|uniref:Uncharacterized protein n=1 Tax=Rhynocoris fuscipes TaxID=488301 RepID=A0AAW1DLQ9_9HEMI